MLDIGFGELLLLMVLGLVVLGPDRLPQFAAQAARFMRQLRGQVADAKASFTEVAAIDPETLRDIRDLDPRRVLRGVDEPAGPARREPPLDPDTT